MSWFNDAKIAVVTFATAATTQVKDCDKPIPPIPLDRNAELVETIVPEEVFVGETYNIHYTIKNTGRLMWDKTNFKLGKQGGDGNLDRVLIDQDVPSTGVAHFNMPWKPNKEGKNILTYQMLEENVVWFGPVFEKEIEVKKKSLWSQIVDETGITDTDQAPFRGKYLGDCWSQYLESPTTIKAIRKYNNITEIGVFLSYHGYFEEYLKGNQTIEEAVKTAGPTFGQKNLTLYDSFMIASKIGMPVLLTLDGSHNAWPGGYHDFNKCINSQRIICGPYTRPGEMEKVKRLVSDLLLYINTQWPDLVKYVWFENEPCFRTFNNDTMRAAIKALSPIVRAKMPNAKIGFDADCEGMSISGLDVDAVGFHFAIPKTSWSNDYLVGQIKARISQLKARYPGKELWLDEFGIGRLPATAYSKEGAERYYRSIDAAFMSGVKGIIYLINGGMDDCEADWQNCIFTKSRGESPSVQAIKSLANKHDISW